MEPESQPDISPVTQTKQRPPWAQLIIIIVLTAIVVGAGTFGLTYYTNKKLNDDLRSQITTLKTQVSTSTSTPTPSASTSATADQTAGWKTYSDSATGLSFKYPTELTPNPDQHTGLTLSVWATKISDIQDNATLWYDKTTAQAESAALTQGSLTKTHGAEKLLTLSNGAVGATAMNLSAISCDNVMFNREAHIYKDGYQIVIKLDQLAIDTMKANNPSYFAANSECTGNTTTQIWKTGNTFAADVAAGKTDALSQTWYTDFTKMIDSITFSSKITYSNTAFGYSFSYPSTASLLTNGGGDSTDLSTATATSSLVKVHPAGAATGAGIFTIEDPTMSTLTTATIAAQFSGTSAANLQTTTTKVAGTDGYKVVILNDSSVVSDFYYFKTASNKILEVVVAKNNTDALAILASLQLK